MWWIALATAWAGPVELGKKVVAVELTSVSGAITARTDPAATAARLVRTDTLDPKLCDLEIDAKGDTAVATFGPRSAAQPEKCSADFEIWLPPGGRARLATGQGLVRALDTDADLDLTSGRGGLTLERTTGPVTARIPEGDVRLDAVSGALSLEVTRGEVRGVGAGALAITVDQGAVELTGLRGPATVTARRGRVLLTFAEVPTGTIEARATGGPVVVDLPGSPTVTCHVAATGGTATCELPQAPDAPLTVHAIADGAAVRVH